MIDEETGARGFLLSQDPVTLEPWDKANARIGPQFDELAHLVIDNPVQEERLSAIRTSHDSWRRAAEQRIVQTVPLSKRSTVVLQDKSRMDELRREVAGFLQTEEQLRQIRSRQTARSPVALSQD
jgi:CHASE3 domain sensor protein